MKTAKVFWSGNSQAIRLPGEFRFPETVDEVEISREGSRIIISLVRRREFGKDFYAILGNMPDFKRPPQTKTHRAPIFP
jgi:virulence-associated protein VagC